MKRVLLLILAACAAALVAWRVTRYPDAPPVAWPEADDGDATE
ncbi:MAG: hypothetical protein ACHQNA_07315 [Acidimicrobiales bacterium]